MHEIAVANDRYNHYPKALVSYTRSTKFRKAFCPKSR